MKRILYILILLFFPFGIVSVSAINKLKWDTKVVQYSPAVKHPDAKKQKKLPAGCVMLRVKILPMMPPNFELEDKTGGGGRDLKEFKDVNVQEGYVYFFYQIDPEYPIQKLRFQAKGYANYVEKDGILPNTLTLATRSNGENTLRVEPHPEVAGLFYMDFPETPEEFERYKDSADVMDGQHRLFSFLPNIRTISDDSIYEIGFTIFIEPTVDERRKIFINCNEKQEKVSDNLLWWFKEKLGMLSNDEKRYFSLISKLNENAPLKGRIIMNAERIKNGIKAKQMMDALKKAHIDDLRNRGERLEEEKMVRVIATYLRAWEKVCEFSFSPNSTTTSGAYYKLAGIRFMLLLLKPMWDRAAVKRVRFESVYIEDTIKRLIQSYAVERNEFFTNEVHKMWFRDRSAIDVAAIEAANKIAALGDEEFDLLS